MYIREGKELVFLGKHFAFLMETKKIAVFFWDEDIEEEPRKQIFPKRLQFNKIMNGNITENMINLEDEEKNSVSNQNTVHENFLTSLC